VYNIYWTSLASLTPLNIRRAQENLLLEQWNLPITELQGAEFFSVAGSFRFIAVLEFCILGNPYARDYKRFLLKTDFCYAQVPFKTGFTVYVLHNADINAVKHNMCISGLCRLQFGCCCVIAKTKGIKILVWYRYFILMYEQLNFI
jgi:hypothetical protein